MARFFDAWLRSTAEGIVFVEIAFGDSASNAEIVPDSLQAIADLHLKGGRGIKFSGPASAPVAFAIAHSVADLYGFVAWWDPKLGKFVVAISHDPHFRPGDLLD